MCTVNEFDRVVYINLTWTPDIHNDSYHIFVFILRLVLMFTILFVQPEVTLIFYLSTIYGLGLLNELPWMCSVM